MDERQTPMGQFSRALANPRRWTRQPVSPLGQNYRPPESILAWRDILQAAGNALKTDTSTLDAPGGMMAAAADPAALRATDTLPMPDAVMFGSNFLPGAGDVKGLIEDAPAVYEAGRAAWDDPSLANLAKAGGLAALAGAGALPFLPGGMTKATGNVADALRSAENAGDAAPGIRAYHGSPHDFDRFDISKIGTGEGAQAYGHGLYFAEAEDTAKAYRDGLAGADVFIGGRPVPHGSKAYNIFEESGRDLKKARKKAEGRAAIARENHEQAVALAKRKSLEEFLPQSEREYYAALPEQMKQRLDEAEETARLLRMRGDGSGVMTKPRGHMYEVNIRANPDDFLDWDKPLNAQPQKVRDVFNRVARDPSHALAKVDESMRPSYLLPALRDQMGGIDWPIDATPDVRAQFRGAADAKVSGTLREAGIPGIKYLDQRSRAAGEGSRNYVVFDDKLIDILRKYGLAGLLAGMGAFGGASIPTSQAEASEAR
jgi:hypothetical protein